jgi:hydroxymethylbilane synthase
VTVRIATRRSPLALWQTHHVRQLLQMAQPGLSVEVVDLETSADQQLDLRIADIGGKGAFCKEVQALVLDGVADVAVHSAKDLQAETPAGLRLAAVPNRGDARDALIGCRLADLRPGALVATGSQRRRVQLAEIRPDLQFAELRGNIATRLGRLGEFDAIVMAAVALERLEIELPVVEILEPEVMLPQVGQGALAVECRSGDASVLEILALLDHHDSRTLVDAERDFLKELGGDCDLPAGAHARFVGEDVMVVGVLAADVDRPDTVRRASLTAPAVDRPGRMLARRLAARL